MTTGRINQVTIIIINSDASAFVYNDEAKAIAEAPKCLATFFVFTRLINVYD